MKLKHILLATLLIIIGLVLENQTLFFTEMVPYRFYALFGGVSWLVYGILPQVMEILKGEQQDD